MKSFEDKSLTYFGKDYELKVLKNLIGTLELKGNGTLRDDSFGRKMINKMNAEHFTNDLARRIFVFLKNYFTSKNKIPFYDTISSFVRAKVENEYEQEMIFQYLKDIEKVSMDDSEWVQENTISFINTKNLISSWNKCLENYINKGKYDKYFEISEIMTEAIVQMNDEAPLEAFVAGDYRHLEEGERHPIPTGIEALDVDMNGGLAYGEFALVIAPSGIGKAQPAFSKIYTPDGYKLMKDIQVGDTIFGSDGKTQTILGFYPQGEKEYYKVTMNDNSFTYSCKEHLWTVYKEGKKHTLSLGQIMDNLRYNGIRKALKYRIPITPAVEYSKKDNYIHPYVLGVLLGDGYLSERDSVMLSCSEDELLNEFIKKVNEGCVLKYSQKYDYRITTKKGYPNPFKTYLRELNLLGKKSDTKFIPDNYMFTSIEDRLELLRGLIDSDGYVNKKGSIQYSSASITLINNVRDLVKSLGGHCGEIKIKTKKYTYKGIKKEGKTAYIITFTFNENIKLSYLQRKQERITPRDKYSNSKFIKDVVLVDKEECYCIKVSNEDELYVTDDFILTHNTTYATYVANNGAKFGYNVLQIFFEDTVEQIKMKHISKLIGKPINFSSNKKNRKTVIKETDSKLEKIRSSGGCLVPLSMDSTETTVEDIKKVYKRAMEQGVYFPDTGELKKIKFDLVLIDYLDCIKSKRNHEKQWEGQTEIARDLEKLCGKEELHFACWAFTQGTKGSLNTKIVTGEQMGGDFGKYKVAHFVMSFARDLEQQSQNRATVAILKNRMGRAGILYQDCIFDNGNMLIEFNKEEFLTEKTVNDTLTSYSNSYE
jgi:replicative DNA helicase